MDYPVIDKNLCSGCGACVDVCPMEAIEIVNGIAKIITDNCSNCRICESECPVEAIS